MKLSAAEAAKILSVERDLIKTWAVKFADHMTKGANPSKGIPREFGLDDIRVMAYVLQYWEDNPDIECIAMGLNSGSHYDHPLIDNLIFQITPVFVEPPENLDETWKHGVIYAGLAQITDAYFLAKSFKLAGDRLVEAALESQENWELLCPVLYNYRHSMELYLKATTNNFKRSHNLRYLFGQLKDLLKKEFNTTPPLWVNNLIEIFNDFDENGTSFRYGGNTNRSEVWVDFHHLKTLMGWLAESFHNIRLHQEITYDL